MAEDFQLFTSMRFDCILESVRDKTRCDLGWNSERPSPFYMLDYHRDRMLKAATHWGWTKAVATIEGSHGLARLHSFLRETLEQDGRWENKQPLRLRVILSQDGMLALESFVAPPISLSNLFPEELPALDAEGNPQPPSKDLQLGPLELVPVYDVYLDQNPTASSEFTHFKTTKRDMYNQARQRAGLKPTDTTKEVLIVNEAGTVMEGSLTTPYFWRRGRWVTPPVSRAFEDQFREGCGGQDGTTRRWALQLNVVQPEEVEASSVVDGEAVWLSNGVRGFVHGRIRVLKP